MKEARTMSSVVQRENPNSKRNRRMRDPNRGRPRKLLPPRPPLVHSVSQFAFLTNKSRSTVLRLIAVGKLRALPSEGRGVPLRIPTSEYVRLGYVESLNELI
jgi:hypothetical protein